MEMKLEFSGRRYGAFGVVENVSSSGEWNRVLCLITKFLGGRKWNWGGEMNVTAFIMKMN